MIDRSEYMKRYREEHREERVAYIKKWRSEHKDKVSEYNRNNYLRRKARKEQEADNGTDES